MEPLTLISGALSIAEATGLTGWIGEKLGGNVGKDTANKIVGLAKTATGLKDPKEIVEALNQDKQLAHELKMQLVDQEQELVRLQYADLADAREMYETTDSEMVDWISKNTFMFNLPVVIVLIIALGLLMFFIKDAALVGAISTLIGGTINHLLQQMRTVQDFFMGSSKK